MAHQPVSNVVSPSSIGRTSTLLAVGEAPISQLSALIAADAGMKPMQAHSLASATAVLAEQSLDVLVLDLSLLCQDVEFLKTTLTTRPNISILLLAQWPAASETQMLSPAIPRCYTKAIRIDGLRAELECREHRVRASDQSSFGVRAALGNIVGGSAQMNCV
jgi:DNA-binding response OmpR family regulator